MPVFRMLNFRLFELQGKAHSVMLFGIFFKEDRNTPKNDTVPKEEIQMEMMGGQPPLK